MAKGPSKVPTIKPISIKAAKVPTVKIGGGSTPKITAPKGANNAVGHFTNRMSAVPKAPMPKISLPKAGGGGSIVHVKPPR